MAVRPGRRRRVARDSRLAQRERERASVRAKVERPFLFINRRFAHAKTLHRGLAKRERRLALLLGFANLVIAEPRLA